MPLSNEVAPCNWCLDVEMYRIADENGEDPNISLVNLNEVTKTSRYCIKCSLPFCPDHASPVDQSDCCVRCLPFEDIKEMRTPLVSQDEYGTHVHKGYRVVPTGAGYKTLPKAISELTEAELTAFIAEKAAQISKVEAQRDYLRIAHSTAKLEKSERDIAASRALRGIKLPPGVITPSNTGIKITGKANGSLKGVALPAGSDLAAFLKFATAKIAEKKSAQASPPSAPAVGGPQIAAPATGVANSASKAVNVGKGGAASATAPPTSFASQQPTAAEAAREAEIEAILEGGEPNGE